jgi:ribosomal protein S18 acetylase RimI-like enzyme
VTIEPYYFPLGPDDVHFFDFYIFPSYRGRGINPYLVGQILHHVAEDNAGRAFIEAKEWNEAQLSSLRKTAFRRLGSVRTLRVPGSNLVLWAEKPPVRVDALGESGPTNRILSAERSNER